MEAWPSLEITVEKFIVSNDFEIAKNVIHESLPGLAREVQHDAEAGMRVRLEADATPDG